MLRLDEKQVYAIDEAIGNAEGKLFDAEGIIGAFIDDYFATPHYEKDDVSMKDLEMAEAMQDIINEAYDATCKLYAVLEYFKNREED